jgi:hypothetical protein
MNSSSQEKKRPINNRICRQGDEFQETAKKNRPKTKFKSGLKRLLHQRQAAS